MNRIIWGPPPVEPVMHKNEVHIYLVKIESMKDNISGLESVLSEEERQRSLKFIFEKDRNNYIISRGILREILSRYLASKAGRITFSYNEYGKPFLDEKFYNKITFNLSHSGKLIVYAVTDGRKVGIDVQEIREMDSFDDIIGRYFSDYENSLFNTLPPDLKKTAFFSCWTRKEAYIKALGSGLSYPLDGFSVSIMPGEKVELLHDENNDITDWSLKEFLSSPEYVAAVAVEGGMVSFNYYKWPVL